MTTLVVEREYDRERKQLVIPISRATDAEFEAFLVEQVREYLHRCGINAAHVPDAQILFQTRNTFANTKRELGRISSAVPVVSR